MPWLGTLQTGVFYPPNLVYLVLAPSTAMVATTLAHLGLAAAGTAWLARRAGLGIEAAILAALLFACRGHLPWLVYWPPTLAGASWLPVGMVGVLELARGRRATGAAIVAVATAASVLPGNPQMTVFLVYAWAIVLLALVAPGGARAGGAVVGFAGALALAALLAAALLVPGMELAAAGGRGMHALTVEQMYPMGGATVRNAALDFVRRSAFGEGDVAIGVVAAALVPAALVDARRRALAWGVVAVGVAALVFALGPVTPLFRPMLALPALGWFRVPNYALFVVDFAVALLAAMGLDAVTAGGRVPAVVAAAVAAALGLAAAAGTIRANAPAAITTAAVVALVAATAVPRGRRIAGVAALACAAAEVASAPPRALAFPYPPRAEYEMVAGGPLYVQIAGLVGHDRFWLFTTGIPPAMIGPKIPSLAHVRAVDDYEPLTTRRQAEYFAYLWEGAPRLARANATFDGYLNTLDAPPGRPGPAARRRLLDLAGVRLVLFPPKTVRRADVQRFVAEAGLRARPALMGVAAWENPSAVPRAYVTYRVLAAPPVDELLGALARPEFDPMAASYVEGAPPFEPAADAPARGVPAAIVEDGDRAVAIDATLERQGLVVLADTVFPGWHATVDGTPAPIVPTNHLFRGVPVPAGRHRVRFEYHPRSVRTGVALSAVGVATLAALVAAARRRDA